MTQKISLKALCIELKVDPREARKLLREACSDPKKFPELKKAHKPGDVWEWTKGSAAEKEARSLLVS
ncbi:hypothetical protein [Parvularcula marina]|uniref:Uncharacterized protein n=1 Tax=Parvularcula marina TaxID=2292771 RepID=A0A371R7H2_9PROT|nr:hypothetical protein [Parvularcula marina]RFB01410.1 hypothetical protein DX908_14050 [Parvularcula marina]